MARHYPLYEVENDPEERLYECVVCGSHSPNWKFCSSACKRDAMEPFHMPTRTVHHYDVLRLEWDKCKLFINMCRSQGFTVEIGASL